MSSRQVGLATKLVEVTALGLALVPLRGEVGRTHPTHHALRWATLGVAMPLLIVISGATVWIVDLARPDARHVHAGALLQSTNSVPTPTQVEAANHLYEETKAAIQPSSLMPTGIRHLRPATDRADRRPCRRRTG